ncbi:hypothetical protein ACFQAT_28475 [Undibacterium arcticum]|uniref:ANTAR domain-containing protein n=1 Tax=Undibacterium arcticum TaxID=1762892 RepID=A0ABV7F6Z3_9BURK
MTVQKKVAPRGRPVTGKAKSSTERGKELEAALLASGGRILSRVRLSPEAALALATLSERYGSDRGAIEQALIVASKIV